MRYIVDILNRAHGALESDNLRGERRWERQVARALLDAGRMVGSVSESWDHPDSPHWAGRVKNLGGCTLITQADPGTIRYRPGARAFVTNVFSVLLPEAEAEIRRAVAEMGRDRVALTNSFQVHVPLKRLPPDLHDIVRWLPPPAVPAVHWNHDPFTNKVLLWSGRAIHLHLMSVQPPILALLGWIRGALLDDRSLRFEVLAGEERMNQAQADAYVWGFTPFANAFADLRDRIHIHPSISWTEVQAVYARTKLVVNAPMTFGGPPIEAASYGIPVVGTHISAFHTADASAPEPSHTSTPAFPEYRGTDAVNLIDQLETWHRDAEAYHEAGNAYRRYVDATYTHAAFVRHLDGLSVLR